MSKCHCKKIRGIVAIALLQGGSATNCNNVLSRSDFVLVVAVGIFVPSVTN